MAEQDTGQERTEAPSQRRRDEAHREGRVPRSPELSGAAVLLTGTAALATVAGAAFATFTHTLFVQSLAWGAAGIPDIGGAASLLRAVGWRALAAAVPFLGLLTGGVLLVNLIQARGVVSLTPLALKWERVSPAAGVGRLFSTQSVFTAGKALAKLTLLAWLAWGALHRAWPALLVLPGLPPQAILATMTSLATKLALLTGLAFLGLAGADYGYQVWEFEKSLRMTKLELTQEFRETEGDPLIKSRIRAVARALSRRQMLRRVATADVVITNPTHLAVALTYDPSEASAPIVVAMGARKLAERIKALAAAGGVPCVENRPLAQALFKAGTVGYPVPPALYVAVAEVLAFVYRIKRQSAPGMPEAAR